MKINIIKHNPTKYYPPPSRKIIAHPQILFPHVVYRQKPRVYRLMNSMNNCDACDNNCGMASHVYNKCCNQCKSITGPHTIDCYNRNPKCVNNCGRYSNCSKNDLISRDIRWKKCCYKCDGGSLNHTSKCNLRNKNKDSPENNEIKKFISNPRKLTQEQIDNIIDYLKIYKPGKHKIRLYNYPHPVYSSIYLNDLKKLLARDWNIGHKIIKKLYYI